MPAIKNLGILMLAIYLIAVGLRAFINLGELRQIIDVLAIIAGVLLLLNR